MMITGRQIRAARAMLGWTLRELSLRTAVPLDDLARAESVDDTPGITLTYATSIKMAFERAGLVVGRDGGVWLIIREVRPEA